MDLVLVLGYLFILPLTWETLKVLRVPERLELGAGILLTFAYGFLGTAIIARFV